MIDSITIKGFLSIRSIRDLPLRPLNILIGANGAGKSCLIDAIRLFRIAATRPSRIPGYVEAQGGAHRVLHYGPKVTSAHSHGGDRERFRVRLRSCPRNQ